MTTPPTSKIRRNRFAIQGNDAGGGEMIRAMSDVDTPASKLDTQWVPITSVRPDPNNPRTLNMTLERLMVDVESIEDDAERLLIEELQSLAASILDDGLSNPIEVYAIPGGGYMLVSGERRYWSSLYNYERAAPDQRLVLGEVRATVYKTKPSRLRRKQLSENRLRSALSLPDQMHSIKAAFEEIQSEQPEEISTARAFADALHIPYHEARAWFPTLTRWPGLATAVANGKITAIRSLIRILGLKDEQISKLIPKIAQYGYSDDLLEEIKAPQLPSPERKARRGRPVQYVVKPSLDSKAAHRIYQALADSIGLPSAADINWTDRKQAGKAFEALLKRISVETPGE